MSPQQIIKHLKNYLKKSENSLLAHYRPKQKSEEDDNDLKCSNLFDTKERSLKIALFCLNQQSSKVTVEKILPLLISENLVSSNASLQDLYSSIPIQDKGLIDKAIHNMMIDMAIIENSGRYSLSAHRIEQLQEIAKTVDTEEHQVKQKLYKLYFKTQSISFDYFLDKISKCISLIVYKTTSKVNDYFSNFSDTPYDSDILKKIILDSIMTYIDENAIKITEWQKMIIEIFESKDKQIISWINSIHKSFWFLAAIGCDGQTNALFRDNIEDYNIFFDSHVVLRGMLNSGSDADICLDILQKGKRLNVPMYLSEPMFSEVSKAFEQADNFFTACSDDINRVTILLEDLGKKHDVVDAFFRQKIINNDLQWHEFLSQYFSNRNPEVLETYLSNIHGINIYSNTKFQIEEWNEIQQISNDLMNKRSKTIERKKKQSPNPETEEERQFNLRTNEAKQLEILYLLRSKSVPNYWFVTYDHFIYETCVSLYKSSGNNSKYYPCFMKPNKWLEILSISDKESLNETVYNEILLSPAMHHVVNNIEATVINEILKRHIDTKVRDKEILNNMFKDAVDHIAIADVKKELSTSKYVGNKVDTLDDIIRNVLHKKMSKYDKVFHDQNTEIERIKKDKQKSENKARYYKQQITLLRKDKNSKRKK